MQLFRNILFITAGATGGVLVCRALFGPFLLGPVPVNSPLNAQSVFGLACILLVTTAHRGGYPSDEILPRFILPSVLILTAAAYLPALSVGLLADDYWLLHDTSRYLRDFPWQQGDDFFRPVGVLLFAAAAPLRDATGNAGLHLLGVTLHLAVTTLVFWLARRLGANESAAFVAAALFALHGSRPETVIWVAGWIGALAAIFLLLACHAFLRDIESPSAWTTAAWLLCGALAMWTKETGFSLPLLFTVLAAWKGHIRLNTLPRLAAAYLLTAILFVDRWVRLGGIGGYEDVFRPLGYLKVFALRLWAALFFPLNWSVEPGLVLSVSLLAAAAAYLALARSSPPRRKALFALAFTVASAQPAAVQLLVGANMEKSRSLYLPSIGFCLLIGFAISAIPSVRARRAAAAALVLSHFAILQHNLAIWKRASELSAHVCESVASRIPPETLVIVAHDFPRIWNGVYLYQHGFKECVEQHLPAPLEAVFVSPAAPVGEGVEGVHHLQWDAFAPDR